MKIGALATEKSEPTTEGGLNIFGGESLEEHKLTDEQDESAAEDEEPTK